MKKFRGRAGGERGAVAVEFALIMPVLLMILMGTIEFGRVYSQFQVYNGAAREGARCAAVQAADFSDCVIQTKIDEAAQPYDVATAATVSRSCDDNTVGQPVRVSWVQDFDINIPFWGDVTLDRTIEATFRCE
jgi:Flp pilus assembly protein TadG